MPQQIYIQGSGEAITIEDKPFASGGEGGLHRIINPARFINHVVKIMHPNKRDQEKIEKINYLRNNPPILSTPDQLQSIIWVEQIVVDSTRNFLGFIMPMAKGEKLEILCSPNLPRKLDSSWDRMRHNNKEGAKTTLIHIVVVLTLVLKTYSF